MIGKILSHLLWNTAEELEADNDTSEELMEQEEGEWVIVNVQENGPLSIAEADPLENLLIEHPSMSVYQMRCEVTGEEDDEEELGSDEEDSPRSVAVRHHISWRLAAWGIPLPCNVLAVQKARAQAEHKKMSRSALNRQNLTKTRFSPAEKRYGHFKQPCQRLYNY